MRGPDFLYVLKSVRNLALGLEGIVWVQITLLLSIPIPEALTLVCVQGGSKNLLSWAVTNYALHWLFF